MSQSLSDKMLKYLRALNEKAYLQIIQENNIDGVVDTTPFVFSEATEVFDCLGTMLAEGVWPGYLFGAGAVWSIYIKSLADERWHDALDYIMGIGAPIDLLMLLNETYRLGIPIISDRDYDTIEEFYLMFLPGMGLIRKKTNDAMPVNYRVVEAIRLAKVKPVRGSSVVSSSLSDSAYAALNSEKSTSIKPVRDYQEVYDYLRVYRGAKSHWSVKVDGINTKLLFKEDGSGLEVAVSRGRAADGWDYTEAIKTMVEVQGIDISALSGKVTGEAVTTLEALDLFREKYPDKDYKSPKSTAGAMLRAPTQFDKEDFKHLRFYPFEWGEREKAEAFVMLKESGFPVPPALEYQTSEIPLNSLEEFTVWLDINVLDALWGKVVEYGISSDGVVLQLSGIEETDRADKYSDSNIALKFSHWAEATYQSKVTAILCEQRRVEMSVVLEIEPVVTRDLNTATRVSVGSSAILVNDNVRVGDVIQFTRKSEAINIYIGKK